jgi:hypothetical protein
MKVNAEQYKKHIGEFLKFELIENKTSNRPDLHAFNLLDKLVPGNRGMVSDAGFNKIYLDVSPEQLSEVATEQQIIELIRCGVRYDSSTDSLALFV